MLERFWYSLIFDLIISCKMYYIRGRGGRERERERERGRETERVGGRGQREKSAHIHTYNIIMQC